MPCVAGKYGKFTGKKILILKMADMDWIVPLPNGANLTSFLTGKVRLGSETGTGLGLLYP